MARDTQIVNSKSSAAPSDYTLPSSVEFILKAVNADFDGSAAAGAFLPCVTIVSDSGHVIARAVDQGVQVAAGASAECSFFPGVKHAAGAAATQVAYMFQVDTNPGHPQTIPSGGFHNITWNNAGNVYLSYDNGADPVYSSPGTFTNPPAYPSILKGGYYIVGIYIQWVNAVTWTQAVDLVSPTGAPGIPLTRHGADGETYTLADRTITYYGPLFVLGDVPTDLTAAVFQNSGVSRDVNRAQMVVARVGNVPFLQ